MLSVTENQVELLGWIDNECEQIANALQDGSMSIEDAARFLGSVRRKIAKANEPEREKAHPSPASTAKPNRKANPIDVEELNSIASQYEYAADCIRGAVEVAQDRSQEQVLVRGIEHFFRPLPSVTKTAFSAYAARSAIQLGMRCATMEPSKCPELASVCRNRIAAIA